MNSGVWEGMLEMQRILTCEENNPTQRSENTKNRNTKQNLHFCTHWNVEEMESARKVTHEMENTKTDYEKGETRIHKEYKIRDCKM